MKTKTRLSTIGLIIAACFCLTTFTAAPPTFAGDSPKDASIAMDTATKTLAPAPTKTTDRLSTASVGFVMRADGSAVVGISIRELRIGEKFIAGSTKKETPVVFSYKDSAGNEHECLLTKLNDTQQWPLLKQGGAKLVDLITVIQKADELGWKIKEPILAESAGTEILIVTDSEGGKGFTVFDGDSVKSCWIARHSIVPDRPPQRSTSRNSASAKY